MKRNNNFGGSSFLERFFPFWAVDDDEIQEEDERIAAEAAAQNIDNKNIVDEASASTGSKKDDARDTGSTGGTGGTGGTVNIGSINIGGDVHVHMDTDRSRRDSWSSSRSSDDDVIDVDYVDVTDRVSKKPQVVLKNPAQTPRLTTNQSSQCLSKKQELTKAIRMGDFDALKELDGLIESRDTKKLTELFTDNRPLSFWIKRTTQQHRWDKLPVSIQNIVNQQVL